MRLALVCALCCVPLLAGAQEAVPTVSVSARAKLLGDVLAELGEQTHILMAAYAFTGERRVTVEIKDEPLPQALDDLAVAAVATWDATYILLPQGGAFGPQDQPPCWERPPQTTVTLSGGSGPVDKITSALTALSAAPIGYVPEIASLTVTTSPAQDAALEDVLSQIKGDHLTWARGFWFSPVDRAAIFGRYANLPTEEREQRVLRHVEQMMRLNKTDVRQALEARQREVVSLDPEERAAEIERYATEIRSGINVLNSLSPAVRDKAREAMQIFFEIGLEVYRELSEEEQLETTPIIEAMGELRR